MCFIVDSFACHDIQLSVLAELNTLCQIEISVRRLLLLLHSRLTLYRQHRMTASNVTSLHVKSYYPSLHTPDLKTIGICMGSGQLGRILPVSFEHPL